MVNPLFQGGLLRTVRDMPEVFPFIQKGLQEIFADLTSMFVNLRAYDMLYDGVEINCDKTDFAAKAICAAIGAEKVEKIDEKHFKASLFKEVSRRA